MKRRHLHWLIALLAAAATGLACWGLMHTGEGSRGCLYRIQTEQGTTYLLGSIHIGNRTMLPFGNAIQQAMAHSDTFVYECDTNSEEASARMKERMARAGGSLRDELSQPLYDELTQVCEKLGMAENAFDAARPWAAVNTLAVYATAAELTGDISTALSYGVERQVQHYAQQYGKDAAYLETLDEQVDTLESFSDGLTQYLLQSECDTILNPAMAKGMDATVAEWPEWWRRGDDDFFANQYLSTYLEPGYEDVCREYHEKLLVARNKRMAERLDKLLQEPGNRFVTIGLLHLVLPTDSVLALLRSRGYQVERISGVE